MLDVIVLIAMAVTAAAFAAGLIIHSGVAQIPALIAAAALYMVMAASYLMIARPSRPAGGGSDRIDELEAALEVIDKDLQRIDKVEDDVSRIDLLTARVERLDQAMSNYGTDERAGGPNRFAQITQEIENVHTKIENLRADLEGEAKTQRDKITGDLRSLEALIKQLSADLVDAPIAVREGVVAAEMAPVSRAEIRRIEPEGEAEDGAGGAAELDEDEPAAEQETFAIFEVEEKEEVISSGEGAMGFLGENAPKEGSRADRATEPDLPSADSADISDNEMLEIVSQAIEAGRVDLYLQPTVKLPERKPRYLEAFTRIRTKSDSLIRPRSYLPAAESSGMMPLIDNVLLVKSVQTLRRLGSSSPIQGVFCNISVSTLLDSEFFPELVEFLEENNGLSESLIFEVGQAALAGLGATEMGALDTLAALGYGFSLDHVTDFDLDFVGFRDRSFRFVKTDARTFLRGHEIKGFTAADMKRALDDFDIQLIVEKVTDEDSVAGLLDRGVTLAQGDLFGKAKPMSPALFREIEGADAT